MDAVARQSQASIEQGSKSFAAAARLFDARTRDSVSLLYAWCRHCDDVIDGQLLGFARTERDPTTPQQRLQRLRALTEAAYTDAVPEEPVFQAFARVVRRHAIDRRYPLELLEGFRLDVEGARYATLDDTLRYSYHVAGVVGVMMAQIMGGGTSRRSTAPAISDWRSSSPTSRATSLKMPPTAAAIYRLHGCTRRTWPAICCSRPRMPPPCPA